MILWIAEIIAYLIFSILFYATGELVLCIGTIGRYRPAWKKRVGNGVGEFILFSEISFWIGIGFWFAVGYLAWWLLAP